MQGLSTMLGHSQLVYVIAILLFFCTSIVLGQQNNPVSERKWHVGCELFQMLLEERGMATIQSLESSLDAPSKSVIILTGDLSQLRKDLLARLLQFVGRGGNVLIASDLPRSLSGIGEIKVGPVVAIRNEDHYLSFTDCIRILNIETTHASMLDVHEVVCNRTAWIALPSKPAASSPFRWQVIASLPPDCQPQASSGQPLIIASNSNDSVAGVMVIIADTSILTNGMLWHGDNSIFAIRVSELLARGEKTHLSFVADGRVLPSYKTRIPTATPNISSNPVNEQPLPKRLDVPNTDLETRLQMVNQVLKSIADSNILNEAMANQPRPVNTRGYILAVLGLAAVTGVLLILLYLIRRIPALSRRQAIIPHLSAFHMETGSKQRNSQYGPAAFILAREFCKECSGNCGEREWQNKATHFHYSAAIPNDKAFREKLEYVRSFEISNLVPRVSEKEFLKLGKTIHELRAALRAHETSRAT